MWAFDTAVAPASLAHGSCAALNFWLIPPLTDET
jgi:hypothetical protein